MLCVSPASTSGRISAIDISALGVMTFRPDGGHAPLERPDASYMS
jgi:hypothetical protein